MFSFTVPGRPVPAVRMTQRGTWKPQATRYLQYKAAVGWAAKAAGVIRLECPVAIDIQVYIFGGVVGDWDNYSKSICDGLNGVAYIDDKQIVDGRCRKMVARTRGDERAVVEIREATE